MAKKYRDGLFRDYFSDKMRLLSLCNALLDMDGEDPEEIFINTLDGVFFDELKNDLSCIYRGEILIITEHQSTLNPNMPLRIFWYVAEIFKQYIEPYKGKIYLSQQVILPTPKFFVFYNGKEAEAERRTMNLSEAFRGAADVNLSVQVYNLNAGFNEEFLAKCKPMWEYCAFVNRVKKNEASGMKINAAIAEAFKYCMKNGIMAEYLFGKKGELTSMLGLEYDPEEAKRAFIEYGMEIGEKKGEKKGEEKGKTDTVKNMLSLNLPVNLIMKISGWNEEKILKIAAEIQ